MCYHASEIVKSKQFLQLKYEVSIDRWMRSMHSTELNGQVIMNTWIQCDHWYLRFEVEVLKCNNSPPPKNKNYWNGP